MASISSILNRLLKLEQRKQENFRRSVRANGWIPIDETCSDDIFVVGYPKSGNTWVQSIVSGLLYGCTISLTPERLTQELVPDVHFRLFYKRFGKAQFFKSHHLPQPAYKRVIYMLRDGRDAMVSYHHFLNKLRGENYTWDAISAPNADIPFGTWAGHVNAWALNPFRAEMIVVRYEELLTDTATQIKRIAEFANIQHTNEAIEKIVSETKFERMASRESQFGMEQPMNPNERFVRRGIAGSFQDEYPRDSLEKFLSHSLSTLARFGYA